jgi:hypothetical protein
MGILAFALHAATSEVAVPLDVQVPSFIKALGLDRNLEGHGGELVVGVVFDAGDPRSELVKDRLMAIQKELTRIRVKGRSIRFVPVAVDSRESSEQEKARVLVITPLRPEIVDRVARASEATGVLTFAIVVEDVARGLALGMELSDGHPRFVVNRAATASAGAAFEAGFLALCRIVEVP